MTPTIFACVAFGGAIGAMARAFAMDKLRTLAQTDFPWTTIIVNITACFLIGLILSHNIHPTFQMVACTGFLGGFSTMSTLNDDALSLLRNRKILKFGIYMTLTYACCLLACIAGMSSF